MRSTPRRASSPTRSSGPAPSQSPAISTAPRRISSATGTALGLARSITAAAAAGPVGHPPVPGPARGGRPDPDRQTRRRRPRRRQPLPAHAASELAVGDGVVALASATYPELFLWSWRTKDPPRRIELPAGRAQLPGFTADGKHLVVGEIRRPTAASASATPRPAQEAAFVRSASGRGVLSADRKWLLTGTAAKFRVVEAATGKVEQTLELPAGSDDSLAALTADGKALVVADVKDGRRTTAKAGGFGPAGTTAAATGTQLHLYDLADGKAVSTVPAGKPWDFSATRLVPLGRQFLALCRDGSAPVLDLDGGVVGTIGESPPEPKQPDDDPFAAPFASTVLDKTPLAAVSPDQRSVALSHPADRTVRVYEAATRGEAPADRLGRRGARGHGVRAPTRGTSSRFGRIRSCKSGACCRSRRPGPSRPPRKPPRRGTTCCRRKRQKALAATRKLLAAPDETLALLRANVKAPAALSDAELKKLIDGLGDAKFAARERFTRQLREVGAGVLPRLRRALAENPQPEVKDRLEGVVKDLAARKLDGPPLRDVRAAELAEAVGTPAAAALLKTWAVADAPAELAAESIRAAERLAGRRPAGAKE